jgi:hypothetical protein
MRQSYKLELSPSRQIMEASWEFAIPVVGPEPIQHRLRNKATLQLKNGPFRVLAVRLSSRAATATILPSAMAAGVVPLIRTQHLFMDSNQRSSLCGLLRSYPTVITPSKEIMANISHDAKTAPTKKALLLTSPLCMLPHQQVPMLNGPWPTYDSFIEPNYHHFYISLSRRPKLSLISAHLTA